VLAFIDKVKPDVVTVEIEHVDVDALEAIVAQKSMVPPVFRRVGLSFLFIDVPVHPSPATIKVIQDKYAQKVHLSKAQLPVAPYVDAKNGLEDIKAAGKAFGYPLLLKSKTLAYDGRGNATVKSEEGIAGALKSLVSTDVYVEQFVSFTKEIAVMVARDPAGHIVSYPCVETIQKVVQGFKKIKMMLE